MLIRITKELLDIPKFKRPIKGRAFEVIEILEARHNPSVNNIKVIDIKGYRVPILRDEYELIQGFRGLR